MLIKIHTTCPKCKSGNFVFTLPAEYTIQEKEFVVEASNMSSIALEIALNIFNRSLQSQYHNKIAFKIYNTEDAKLQCTKCSHKWNFAIYKRINETILEHLTRLENEFILTAISTHLDFNLLQLCNKFSINTACQFTEFAPLLIEINPEYNSFIKSLERTKEQLIHDYKNECNNFSLSCFYSQVFIHKITLSIIAKMDLQSSTNHSNEDLDIICDTWAAKKFTPLSEIAEPTDLINILGQQPQSKRKAILKAMARQMHFDMEMEIKKMRSKETWI